MELTTEEQRLCLDIRRLHLESNYSYRVNLLVNLLDRRMGNNQICCPYKEKDGSKSVDEIVVYVLEQGEDLMKKRCAEISQLLLTALTLLQRLEREGYITTKDSPLKDFPEISCGAGTPSTCLKKEVITDSTILELINEYLPKEIFITEKFESLCSSFDLSLRQ